MKTLKTKVKFEKENKQTLSYINLLVYRKIFKDNYYPSGCFPWMGVMS